jgi:hypothetical protein
MGDVVQLEPHLEEGRRKRAIARAFNVPFAFLLAWETFWLRLWNR